MTDGEPRKVEESNGNGRSWGAGRGGEIDEFPRAGRWMLRSRLSSRGRLGAGEAVRSRRRGAGDLDPVGLGGEVRSRPQSGGLRQSRCRGGCLRLGRVVRKPRGVRAVGELVLMVSDRYHLRPTELLLRQCARRWTWKPAPRAAACGSIRCFGNPPGRRRLADGAPGVLKEERIAAVTLRPCMASIGVRDLAAPRLGHDLSASL